MKTRTQLKKPLEAWLSDQLAANKLGSTAYIKPLAGDASSRRYYRVHLTNGNSLILLDASNKENDTKNNWSLSNWAFLNVTHYLQDASIRVPHVLAKDLQQGLFLLEDLGNKLFLQPLQTLIAQKKPDYNTAKLYYNKALTQLGCIQQLPRPTSFKLPDYSEALLLREMKLFEDWLLQKWLGIKLTQAEQQKFTNVTNWLTMMIRQQPYVFTHRDYHARNLMLVTLRNTQGQLVTIDYQDAVWGPLTYDLVSLLRDCYISWPEYFVDELINTYLALYRQNNKSFSFEEFRFWFDLMGLQRHLKASGIFTRLYLRDNKCGYLSDIPRTLLYISRVASYYQQTHFLELLIKERVLPLVIKKLNRLSEPV